MKILKKALYSLKNKESNSSFFLFVTKLTYGKNISDNECQLIFSIHYLVFSIRIVESK